MSDRRKPELPVLEVSFCVRGFEYVARGTDELDLEEICTAICRDQGEAFDGHPEVILLETIRIAAYGEGKYIRQTGGSGNYGHCKVRVAPAEAGSGYEFLNELKDGTIPQQFIEPIDSGIREAIGCGILAGRPVVDVTVTLYDGSYHVTDSNAMAFQIAGAMAFKEAAKKASPVLLEPVMAVAAVVPETLLDSTLKDVIARGGRIEAIKPQELGMTSIKGVVPLRELLRTSPFGRPGYSMRFARYEVVSGRLGESGEFPLGSGVRNPERPILGSGYAAAELNLDLE
jgi:elongation factor G